MHPFVGKRHQNTWYMDGGLEHFLFFHTLGILIPTDICFTGFIGTGAARVSCEVETGADPDARCTTMHDVLGDPLHVLGIV
jgi:hypothetical protein